MNKNDFINEVRNRLSGFSEEEIQASVDYYSEMIDERMDEGMPEEEAVAAVGPVDDAIKEIIDNIPLSEVIRAKAKPKRPLKTWEIVMLVIGSPLWVPLLITAIALIFTFYIVIWVCVITLFAVDLSLMVSGLALFAAGVISVFRMEVTFPLLAIGAGLVLLGVTIMLLPALMALARQTAKLGKTIVLWIKSWFIRRKKDA